MALWYDKSQLPNLVYGYTCYRTIRPSLLIHKLAVHYLIHELKHTYL